MSTISDVFDAIGSGILFVARSASEILAESARQDALKARMRIDLTRALKGLESRMMGDKEAELQKALAEYLRDVPHT